MTLVRLVAPEVMRLVGLTDEQAEKVAAAIVAACGASAATVLPLAARLDQLARLLRAGVETGAATAFPCADCGAESIGFVGGGGRPVRHFCRDHEPDDVES